MPILVWQESGGPFTLHGSLATVILAFIAFRRGFQIGLWMLLTSGDGCQYRVFFVKWNFISEMVNIRALAPALSPIVSMALNVL